MATVPEHLKNLELEFERLTDENTQLKEQLAQFKGQGSSINLANSWKTKYRVGLEKANKKLVELGQKPIQVRNVGK